MTPNKDIFCNTPWYELQIYWDGSYGICCQEDQKLYSAHESKIYNVKQMSIAEWFNSEPVQKFRMAMFDQYKNKFCTKCYKEEIHGGSRRHRSNQKSVIFTKSNFVDSFNQSPGHTHFQHSFKTQGLTDLMPIDLHIDLGNYCNLACKMCKSDASSTYAMQRVKWGFGKDQQYIGTDWTRDDQIWQQVLNELKDIKKLHNVHFMGGETLITKRFEEFVDFMYDNGRTDLNFSFVTNGTIYNETLINKLKKFNRVGIELSVETTTLHNSYVRQGTDNKIVFENLEKYINCVDGSQITLTVRPTLSILTIGYYYTLLEYCLKNKLLIKPLILSQPRYLDIANLSEDIKKFYVNHYRQLIKKYNLEQHSIVQDYNESNPNEHLKSIFQATCQAISLLEQPTTPDELMLQELVKNCKMWDQVYKLDARELYPEFANIFDRYDYSL